MTTSLGGMFFQTVYMCACNHQFFFYMLCQVLCNINVTVVTIYPLYLFSYMLYTVYGKTFERENFRGFRGFLANRESFPLELFAVYST